MPRASRRSFLKTTAATGLACSANLLLGRSAMAQTSGPARVYLDTRRCISPIDRNLFVIPRTSWTGDLRRHLRPGIEAVRFERIPQGHVGGNSEDQRADHPLPRREFCVGLQLARRNRTEKGSACRARQGMEFAEHESVWHGRIHGLVQAGEHKTVDGTEPW